VGSWWSRRGARARADDCRRVSRDWEIEYADGSTELLERGFGDEGFVLAAFEAFVRDLNRALRAKRQP
jgi:hypothetical protein